MKYIDKTISKNDLKNLAGGFSGGLVKAVVDIKKEIMVIDALMHVDEEQKLLESGSIQDDIWGINLYPELEGEDFIEFDSMINVRPRQNNFTRGVEDLEIQKKIKAVVSKLIQ